MEKYEKERRQEILQKLKVRKHKSLQNSFEEIWAETHSSFNPLQSLLNNIRRGDVGLYAEKSSTKSISEQDKNILEQDYSNPKEFLKMLTRQ